MLKTIVELDEIGTVLLGQGVVDGLDNGLIELAVIRLSEIAKIFGVILEMESAVAFDEVEDDVANQVLDGCIVAVAI
jgi:hypothetical protein